MLSVESEILEIWIDLIFARRTKTEAINILHTLADRLTLLDSTQVWILAPEFVEVGKFPSRLLAREVTDELQEKNGWLRFMKSSTSRFIYENHYRLAVVSSCQNANKIRNTINSWATSCIKEGDIVRISEAS